MTGYSWSTPVVMAMPALGVNGPEDDVLDWDSVNWRGHEDNVRRLRQRIFTATQEGDWPKVRSLQKLMLRSRSNTLLSVRQVTQRNAGRKTAGIDGEVALTSQARADVAVWTSPGFPETYLSGIGALWLEGSRLRLVLLPGVPDSLVFVGREPAEALLDAAGVVPSVDVAEQRRLRLCSCGESGCGPVDQLNLDG